MSRDPELLLSLLRVAPSDPQWKGRLRERLAPPARGPTWRLALNMALGLYLMVWWFHVPLSATPLATAPDLASQGVFSDRQLRGQMALQEATNSERTLPHHD